MLANVVVTPSYKFERATQTKTSACQRSHLGASSRPTRFPQSKG